MGCHTWFYRKTETPSFEEMKLVVKDRSEKEIVFLEKLINRRDEIDQDLLEAYPEWTSERASSEFTYWEKLLNFINGSDIDLAEFPEYFFESDLTKETLLEELYASWSDELTYIKGKGFFENTEFHDAFRKYGYSDDRLFSLEETLSYINNTENKCSINDWTEKLLKQFWEKYPDGMIQFG